MVSPKWTVPTARIMISDPGLIVTPLFAVDDLLSVETQSGSGVPPASVPDKQLCMQPATHKFL